MFEMIDDVAWAELSSATGTAVGIPAMLRAIAAGVEPAAGQAVGELYNEVYHQGTVWGCTSPAVPFIVELAVSGPATHRDSLVNLLAMLGWSGDVDEVGEHATPIMPLLTDPDASVRQSAAYALALCPDHDGLILIALRRQWTIERDALARASLLAAIAESSHEVGTPLAVDALDDPAPTLRAAAAMVLGWMAEWWPEAEVSFPDHCVEAVASAYRHSDPLDGWVWTQSDPLSELLDMFHNAGLVTDSIIGQMLDSPLTSTRSLAVYEIQHAGLKSRSAPQRLVPLLAPTLRDPDPQVRNWAARVVRESGSAAALLADELVTLAATLEQADSEARAGGEWALCALFEIGDPRWFTATLAAWRHDRALDQFADALLEAAPPVDEDLLAGLRGRLSRLTPLGRGRTELGRLVRLLCQWGPSAAPAVPELTAALEQEVSHDRVVAGDLCRALASTGPAALPAAGLIRSAAELGFHNYDRVQAGIALWRLTGDASLALATGDPWRLDGTDDQVSYLVADLLSLGSQVTPLVPALRRHLAERPDLLATNTAIVRILWRLNRDEDEVLPTLRAALSFTKGPSLTAVEAVADLGEHARPLAGQMRSLLSDGPGLPRALMARLLWRLGAVNADELAEFIGPLATHGWGADQALDLLVEARAVRVVPRLREFVDRDRRVRLGDTSTIIRNDERLRTRAIDALKRLDF